MNYLNFTLVNGVVTVGKQSTIDKFCLFTASGNIWSLDGPTFGYLVSIAVTFVNQAEGRVAYDSRPLNGAVADVDLHSTWGTAIVQPDGRYVISIG